MTIIPMDRNTLYAVLVVLTLPYIEATMQTCPSYKNCLCGGTLSVKIDCIVNGQSVKIDILPGVYMNVKCDNVTKINYNELPNSINRLSNFKSVSFINCPLPTVSFKEVLTTLGANKTMTLIFQSNKNLSIEFQRNHFVGLQELTKLLLSVNSITYLPSNLFLDLYNLKWLNIRMKSAAISKDLFKPLKKLDTLEISHNQMTNLSSNVFEHLTYLRKFSLWQSNISTFSKNFFEQVISLEDLDLSSTLLSELPPEIFYPLKNLKKVTLFSNRFSKMPEKLFSRNKLLDTIIILNNNVKITELPKMFLGNLPNLKKVHIQRCGIKSISYDIFLNSSLITNLSIALNEISYLPESVFNNQINLLELDVSHNKLRTLGAKLFSSLVKLERLNLCCNEISEISGSTFSSLITLTYLNMEQNRLKFISSNLFENNRQKMSISFAFNELSFEDKELVNNSWTIRRNSPLMYTYNLKMLNLSHNKFRVAFTDWWTNGHENIDLRFNYIENLWVMEESKLSTNYETAINSPLKEIWIGNNNLNCGCRNLWFFDYIQTHWKTKIMDFDSSQCSAWWSSRITCYEAFYVIMFNAASMLLIIVIIVVTYLIYQNKIISFLKRMCQRYSQPGFETQKDKDREIALSYSIADEEFVLKEIAPGLQHCKDIKLLMTPVSTINTENIFFKKKRESRVDISLVIFSPNYLMTTYSHVNIKKIRGEMFKGKNNIYVFVDTGPDNSIYAFLKEQRDTRISLLWNELNFWDKVINMLLRKFQIRKEICISNNIQFGNKNCVSVREIKKCKGNSPKTSFMKLSEWPHTDTFETFVHSQV